MMIHYELLILIAVFSFVYTNILTESDQILGGVYKKLNTIFKNDERNAIGLPPHWLFKIIIGCEKCNAGQLALWISLYYNWYDLLINQYYLFVLFNVASSITFTILITIVIKGIYNRYINHE